MTATDNIAQTICIILYSKTARFEACPEEYIHRYRTLFVNSKHYTGQAERVKYFWLNTTINLSTSYP